MVEGFASSFGLARESPICVGHHFDESDERAVDRAVSSWGWAVVPIFHKKVLELVHILHVVVAPRDLEREKESPSDESPVDE